MKHLFALAWLALLLAGCRNDIAIEAPPREAPGLVIPDLQSRLAVPVSIPLESIRTIIARNVPRELYEIDETRGNCAPTERVSVLGRDVRVTPRISCRIVGNVWRGNLTLRGEGRDLVIRMPVTAVVSARDIGGVLSGETATGSAVVEAVVRVDIRRDWSPAAQVDLRYNWSRPPGIDILGQRITFMQEADEQLRPVMARVEREIERELERVNVRSRVADLWRQAFTVESLNRDDPPAWLYLQPRKVGIASMATTRSSLVLNLVMEATTRTYLGERPEPPEPASLPPNEVPQGAGQLDLFLPVLSEYALLEPIVLRELRVLAESGINLPGVGQVDAHFTSVEVYPTQGGRIAVGIELTMTPTQGAARRYGTVEGQVWLTGLVEGDYDSRDVSISDLQVYGDTDRLASDLLLKFARSPELDAQIEAALQENFEREYAHVLEAAGEALEAVRIGNFVLSAEIETVRHGQVRAAAQGLYLPLAVQGSGRITFVD
ncbi:DUF4403 family protein [Erythrobacter alti]|uniref:DUF4403 family protein n=1 Tax=Erythrobacter alti TaxID=1896145 RepID=UPI0030F4AB3C